MSHTITQTSIGVVKNQFQTNTPGEQIRAQTSQIIIDPEFVPGLLGLKPGMDILVLFCINQATPDEVSLQLHPCHDETQPVRGVFATRSQFRPNSIGATVAHLEAIEEAILTIHGLDALDDTPILDIKPYTPSFDADRQAQQLEARKVYSLQEARDSIDLIDTEIIRLFGNRAKFVHQVVDYKNTPTEIRAQSRYDEVMRRRREMAEEAGLNPDVIEAMYTLLVENFIKEEMEILEKRQGKASE